MADTDTNYDGYRPIPLLIFGDPADFAIEVGIETHLTPPSPVWGRMRVWCQGNPLGDINDWHCGLYVPYEQFQRLADRVDELWDESLVGLSNEEAFDHLDRLLYGFRKRVELEDHRTHQQLAADSKRFGKFIFLTNWEEMFDGFKAFLLSPPKGPVRVLCREFPASVGIRTDVTREGLVRAAKDFVRWFEDQQRRLSGEPK